MTQWIDPPPVAVPPALREAVGGHPLVVEVLARRGFTDPQAALAFLDPSRYSPSPPAALPGLPLAADRVQQAIARQEPICIWGDFDVDGQTSTALLLSALRDLGAAVTYYIPLRESESHGIHLPALRRVLAEGARLVLTCDTGIDAFEPAGLMRQQGVDFIITDHHELPAHLPDAHSIVNPRLLPDAHPLGALPGVGVACKLVEELYLRVSRAEALEQHLDLVALGIVADLARQVADTRYLLQRGLAVLRQGRRLGLRVLLEQAGVEPSALSAEQISWTLGPRLNSMGRLADARDAVEFLLTSDPARARVTVDTLEGLNARRRLLADQVFQAAAGQVERDPALRSAPALVLANPAWPAGVLGAVASRLVEVYNRPAILFAAPPGQLARGSARSVEGLNITALLGRHGQWLASSGGHAMAAGLSIHMDDLPAFRDAVLRDVQDALGEVRAEPLLPVDAYLDLGDLSPELLGELNRLAPVGAGNPPLVFASRGLALRERQTFGRSDEHLRLVVEDSRGTVRTVIRWQGAPTSLPEGQFDLAYRVRPPKLDRASSARADTDVQLEWMDIRATASPAGAVSSRRQVEVVDCRAADDPLAVLHGLQGRGPVQVWCEGEARAAVGGRDRTELAPAEDLVIWTSPPGRAELRAALASVMPLRVYVFSHDPGVNGPEAFLKRLAGLCKYVLRTREGQVRLAVLAAATAQREATVQAGLAWLEAGGHLAMLSQEAGSDVHLLPGTAENGRSPDHAVRAEQLKALLEESAAYRAYFSRADASRLVLTEIDDLPAGG
jgi:single-stranded-DNA-specific exonuclease